MAAHILEAFSICIRSTKALTPCLWHLTVPSVLPVTWERSSWPGTEVCVCVSAWGWDVSAWSVLEVALRHFCHASAHVGLRTAASPAGKPSLLHRLAERNPGEDASSSCRSQLLNLQFRGNCTSAKPAVLEANLPL